MKYVTKKVPEDAQPLLNRFQAEYTLETGEKITEGQAFKKALQDALKYRKEKRVNRKRYSLKDLKGFIKGGLKTNATEEIDHVVYGI
ncbi:hypothetical protein HY572_00025 [Candidatus Micrarchaeota archaeon]|nr:hypothetical protein [Candidatus Micrarchaeota archaeon]